MSLTSVIRYVRALDSAATDGSGKTGLLFGGITASYLTQGGTLTALTTETITTLGTYQAPTDAAHIRIKELAGSDPTKGVYEVHFHNTQVAESGKKLWLFLSASGAAFQPLELTLDAANTTNITGGTITNLTNAPGAGDFTATMKASLNAATPTVTAGTVSDKTGYALTSAYDFAKGTVAVTESYSADGAAPTPVQALMLIMQALTEFTISGVTYRINKVDGSTQAAALTLNDATNPTAATRSA